MRTIGGRYELCGAIASGGMATVHLARQVGAAGFARMVAVKQLHERFAHAPEFVTMFLDEARLVARIRHVNVVQTLDVVHERESSELFIVMEYVHGVALNQVLQSARQRFVPIAPAVAAAVMIGALHGLHDAHEARSETGEPLGIVHRDVSPHNILVGLDGAPRVLDFGVAKAEERISSTNEGELKGKLSYMSPEQIESRAVDRRTDVYAAAVVFWEMLSGKKLFLAGNEGAVVRQILESVVEPPSKGQPAVSTALDRVVMRGLERDVGERWATARAFAEAIGATVTPASPAEVGAWLRDLCGATIAERDEAIAMIEAKSSGQNLADLQASLRAMGLVGGADAKDASMSEETERRPPAPASTPSSARVSARGTLMLTDGAAPAATPMPMSVARTLPIVTSRSPAPAPSAAPAGEGTSTRTSIAAPVRRSSGARASVAVGAVILLGLGGVGAWVGARRGASPPPPVVASASASVSAPASCPEGMVLVEGGRFFMGTDDGPDDERPAHHVKVHAFCIDRLEVTANAYRACSDRGDCKRAPDTNRFEGMSETEHKVYDPLCTGVAPALGAHPINCVDWTMADRFCRVNDKRLPTEAEWEFAARGSDGRRYPWGDVAPGPKHLNACGRECDGWFKKNKQPSQGALHAGNDGWPTTAPVGSFPAGASRWGAEDMAGNVWEWVADWHGAYARDDATDPAGPTEGTTRVIRGGAWNGSSEAWVRSTFRFHADPGERNHGTGFRCAKSLP
ncbi:MAG: SUMF1/EgtB/PvdO family nonheme iron enzyme [Labilithrix sp.]|nr:SUMF1/EgtB/PvdO family nonheme iron enzyme [Labilithrix sp.]MCW5811817.1 SUMF1/EgtB/PvdO family nonheme iron enzyme [Labilithrix sp.]